MARDVNQLQGGLELECPVCFLIPTGIIYQCEDGHLFCEKCEGQITTCPQCRGKLSATKKIRNRGLESVMDKYQFNCYHQELGCPEMFYRGQLIDHASHCIYRPMELCKELGFNCNFEAATTSKAAAFCTHLQDKHGMITTVDKSEINLHLKRFVDAPMTGVRFWTPLGVKITDTEESRGNGKFALIQGYLRNGMLSYYFVPFGGGGDFQAEMELSVDRTAEEVSLIKWSVSSIDIMNVKKHLLNPLVMISAQNLKENYLTQNGDLAMKVTIKMNGISGTSMNEIAGRRLIYDLVIDDRSLVRSLDNLDFQATHRRFHARARMSMRMRNRPDPEQLRAFLSANSRRDRSLTTDLPRRDTAEPNPDSHPTADPVLSNTEGQHARFECNSCGSRCNLNSRIASRVRRYRCLHCENYSLCQACMDRNEHLHHIFAILKNTSEEERLNQAQAASLNLYGRLNLFPYFSPEISGVVTRRNNGIHRFTGVTCDGCRDNSINRMIFKCLECRNLDICQSCYWRGFHSEHIFAVLNNSSQNSFIETQRSPIINLNGQVPLA